MTFEAELERMHAACDDAFGVRASFRPAAGGAHPCAVEKHAPAPAFGLGEAQAVEADLVLRVRTSTLPARPKKNDLFELFAADGVTVAETLRVLETPTIEDDDGLRYTIKVEAAS
ncbi:MAG TPA: hypothetical protein VEA80_06565 [Vitreimonas sp.]|uniref:head-tail joining protein n=1 Tax=Vitreimonas sp. TaxID=3069702 RepID=UPI002D66833E|nr:hypothetical protein [Vitreimonas sp.]HYD87116.1 hypothetical protein [Vitreimonas sp.]